MDERTVVIVIDVVVSEHYRNVVIKIFNEYCINYKYMTVASFIYKPKQLIDLMSLFAARLPSVFLILTLSVVLYIFYGCVNVPLYWMHLCRNCRRC